MSDEEPTRAEPSPPTTPSGPSAQSSGQEPQDGRTRLLAALRTGSRGQLVVAGLLAVLGFAAVTQVHATDRDDAYVGARQGDLIQYINNLSLASQRTQTEIAQLQETRDALRDDTESRRTALELARQQADTLGILAGTVPAVGPGVRITVTGGSAGVGTNQLLNGLEELRDAGAEVIEMNDTVRVIAQTSLSDTAGGVLVDGERLTGPYVIDAIGDPHTLSTAMDFTGGFISEVRDVGGKVTVDQRDRVEVVSVRRPTAPTYAKPTSTG
jgi:uncharacterized protein YlxW (UPF0749 family)